METFKVRVTKDYLTFCSGHFIIFDNDRCEQLHGHNYRVAAEIEGPLNGDSLVFDFITLKRVLRDIVNELDHRMLIPLKSRRLKVEHDDRSVRLSSGEKEWVFPRGDCVLLEIENTTSELLARWVAGRLRQEIRRSEKQGAGDLRFPGTIIPGTIRIEVEESPGQSALYESID